MSTALVLSGGGAKGSFEVGALQYLYEKGFLASSICSTSVGSVNGIQLAHGGTVETQAAAFNTLKSIWQTELTFNEDMYAEAPWLAGVSDRTRQAIERLFSGAIDVPRILAEVLFFPPFAIGQAIELGADLREALEGMRRASSIFTLDPTRTKINARLSSATVAASRVKLRLVVVSLDSGAIRYVTQDGRVTETNGRPVYGPNPTDCRSERAAYNVALNAKTAAGHALAVASREDRPEARREYEEASAAAADAKAALAACMTSATAAGTATQLTVPLADGVIASSSIPCIFPPVVLGDEAYVDGGIRWVLPLQAAVDLDSDAIVAINASPGGVPPARRAYRSASILDIAERSVLEILLWETQERHLAAVRQEAQRRGQRVWVITPRVDVHDTLTIDPGLIDINIGYGYMCAADVTSAFQFATRPTLPRVAAPGAVPVVPGGGPPRPIPAPARTALFVEEPTDPAQAALADGIARCRRRCWELEHQVFGAIIGELPFSPRRELNLVPDPDALDQLRPLKTLLGLMVAARQMTLGRLPADAPMWADNWERHRWMPADVPGVGDTPWNAFSSGLGTRPAATRQTALVAKAPDAPQIFLLNPNRHLFPTEAALDPYGGRGIVTEVPSELLNAIPRGADVAV